ncbi:hypothetical protein M569_13960 [Genlisea aurea]|uniref:Uncharacterized protein n=1 Tax=Genlisea aurea TaxID=192259 RepID=S8C2H0_9LAMI|nr:hypothetical protein M569_13960 [Genlisea aurea]
MAALYSPTAAVVLRRRVPEVSSRSISCISSSYDARTTRRKNYLRRKILETLENPATPKLPPGEPILPVRAPLIDGINECDDVQLELNNTELVSEAGREVDDFEKSESIVSVVPGGATESFPFFKHGLWLIAAFLFQTFFVVYFFSSDNEDGKTIVEGNLKDDDSSPAELTSHGIDSTIRLQGLAMEMKIEEIRMMARKARELERTEAQIGDSNEVGDDHRTGIEEEVDSNLTLLRMKLENGKKTISRPSSSSDHIETGHKMGNQDSLFKKKHNFRGLPMDKAKGFTPKDDRNTSSDNYSPSSVDSIQSKKGFTDSRRKPKKEKEKTIKKRSSSKDDAMKSKVMNGIATYLLRA